MNRTILAALLTPLFLAPTACGPDRAPAARIAADVARLAADGCVLVVDLDAPDAAQHLCSAAEPIWPFVANLAPDDGPARAVVLHASEPARVLSASQLRALRAFAVQEPAR